MEAKPAVIVLKEFFGYKPSQVLKDFWPRWPPLRWASS